MHIHNAIILYYMIYIAKFQFFYVQIFFKSFFRYPVGYPENVRYPIKKNCLLRYPIRYQIFDVIFYPDIQCPIFDNFTI